MHLDDYWRPFFRNPSRLFVAHTLLMIRSLSGRITGSSWWFFTLILISTYTANLTHAHTDGHGQLRTPPTWPPSSPSSACWRRSSRPTTSLSRLVSCTARSRPAPAKRSSRYDAAFCRVAVLTRSDKFSWDTSLWPSLIFRVLPTSVEV